MPIAGVKPDITEKDPVRYDIGWWRGYWKRTETQAVIINAGGIVAYYPSKFPLHHRAEFLGGRDLFGELTKAAHDDGLFVMARMDSNRTAEDFYQAHPDWFSRDRDGQPYRAANKYVACINSPYYDDTFPVCCERSSSAPTLTGSPTTAGRAWAAKASATAPTANENFMRRLRKAIPRTADWNDPAYREWIMWSYARRIEVWELNNRATREAGGADCIWSGMNSGSVTSQARSFRDLREISHRADS